MEKLQQTFYHWLPHVIDDVSNEVQQHVSDTLESPIMASNCKKELDCIVHHQHDSNKVWLLRSRSRKRVTMRELLLPRQIHRNGVMNLLPAITQCDNLVLDVTYQDAVRSFREEYQNDDPCQRPCSTLGETDEKTHAKTCPVHLFAQSICELKKTDENLWKIITGTKMEWRGEWQLSRRLELL